MSMLDKLYVVSKGYVLPDSGNILVLDGSPDFQKDMKEMLDIMVHSPTALKILNFNASSPNPLKIEEFENALDLGRNTGKSVQLAHGHLKNGEPISKYSWLTLLPHEIRHSYNTPIKNSNILRSLAYALVNEADAQAIEGLVAVELGEYLEKNKEYVPDAEVVLKHLNEDPKVQFFKSFYDEAKGTDEERKSQAMEMFVKEFAKYQTKDGKSTFGELAYKTALERDTTENGWEKCSDEDLKKIEECLLGKLDSKTVANEPWMKGRKQLSDESKIIRKEWPTFCKRIMDGTFNTDVIKYGQNIKPENLVETISPKLSIHLREIGIYSFTVQSLQQNSGRT